MLYNVLYEPAAYLLYNAAAYIFYKVTMEETMNIIKQFKISIYKFHDYPLLLMEKGSKAAGYFIAFTLLIAVISMIPIINLYISSGGIEKLVDTYVPDFEIKDGKLSCKTIESNQGMLIYINTEEDFDITKKSQEAGMYFIADSDKYVINNGIVSEEGNFKDFENMSEDDLKAIVKSPAFLVSVFVGAAIAVILSFLLSGLVSVTIFALTGNILNMLFTKTHITFGDMFKLSIYARTFPVLFSTVFVIFGMGLPIIIEFGLMVTYMYFGLKNVKSGTGIILARID